MDPKNDVRAAVLEAATRLTAARGFAAMPLQDIADEVSVSKQAVLYHFKSKSGLKLALIDNLLERTHARILALLDELERRPERETLLAQLEQLVEQEPEIPIVLLRFMLDRDDDAIERMRVGVDPWRDPFDRALGGLGDALRPGMNAERLITEVGLFMTASLATLPLGSFNAEPTPAWRRARVGELLDSMGAMLFTDAHLPTVFRV